MENGIRIGETLRKARLEKNISIEEIANETKIRSRYIIGLEEEKWDIFPGKVYVKGFLKSYCSVLGIDARELLEALDKELKLEAESQPVPEKIEMPGRPRKRTGVILGIVAIIFLVAFQYIYNNNLRQSLPIADNKPPVQNTDPVQNNEDTENPGNANTDGENEPSAEENPVTSISLRMVGVKGRCWVRVRDGQEVFFEGILGVGDEKIINDLKRFTITLGNAGVQCYLNDEDYGFLGSDKYVVTKTFVLEDNEIIDITESVN